MRRCKIPTVSVRILLVPVLLGIGILVPARSAFAADQVVTNCSNDTELRNDLSTMQSSGGGTLSFNCAAATIVLTGGVLPSIATDTSIDGGGKITLSGNNASRIFRVNGGGRLSLGNLTLTKGYANDDGGAIYVASGGTLWVASSKFLDNHTAASFSGGAITTYGPLNIVNSEFAFNSGGNAGAVYPRFSAAVTTITNSTFHDNFTTNTTSGWGGAILLWGASVSILDSDLYSNSAKNGGAIYNPFANTAVSLQDSRVRDNKAIAGIGGGIYSEGGALTMNRVTVSGNAAHFGGGLEYTSGNSASLIDITFSGNSATGSGGGMDIRIASGVSLINVTFSNNSAAFGGAINNTKSIAALTNVTIYGNSATLGASGIANGTYSGQGTTLKNTIVAGSLSGANCQDSNTQTILSADGNLSDDNSCAAYFNQAHDRNGAANNPLLGPLALNGGTTQTYLPQAGSPVIDAGIGAGAPFTDQRNMARPQGAAVDMGAVERCPNKPTKPVLLTPANQVKSKGPTIALDWGDVPCAQGYTVSVKLGSPTGAQVQKQSGLQTSAFTTKKLVKKQTYYWQVTAIGDAGKAKSAWWKFTVK